MSNSRNASHAGSWYSGNKDELNHQLSSWLDKVDVQVGSARAIIAPHAGYDYSGSCGAFAYRQVNSSKIKRVFILGPSHHVRLGGCALSPAVKYRTPLYDLPIDQQIYEQLYKTNEFQMMSAKTDEDEHSIELHLPFVAKAMESRCGNFTIVPILVGSLSLEKQHLYGQLLHPYLADPENFFVISSDFCHWGQRFRYTYYDKSFGEIYQSIEHLDKMGMNIIESLDPAAFQDYLEKYENTICGRHPIAVLLNAVSALRTKNHHQYSMKFINYKQSSQCRRSKDSSVSYAAGVLAIN